MRGRGIERISEAIKIIKNVRFLIAGRAIQRNLLEQITAQPNVEYKGVLDPADALALEAKSHVIIALYDLRKPYHRLAAPNKLFESMMLGKPVITNVSSEIVNETGCGILVNYDDTQEITKAIELFKSNKKLRESLGANGRKYFLKRYNWGEMEKVLYGIYDNMLQN
jgi:glycosyltransferase involved in cell wall biosynthesis